MQDQRYLGAGHNYCITTRCCQLSNRPAKIVPGGLLQRTFNQLVKNKTIDLLPLLRLRNNNFDLLLREHAGVNLSLHQEPGSQYAELRIAPSFGLLPYYLNDVQPGNWRSRLINGCNGNAACIRARRIGVAGAFFIEKEFQQTGLFIYGLYKAGLGRQPVYAEFSADRQSVVGGPDLEEQKAAFAEAFVQRARFLEQYQASTTAESFVDALLAAVQESAGVDLSAERTTLVNRYNFGDSLTRRRGLVLREVAENSAFKDAEYNAAFVLAEYFGYLRRDPEPEGYAFWLDVLNNREPGNYRGMICSFITSTEYQRRFSLVVTHTNAECSQ